MTEVSELFLRKCSVDKFYFSDARLFAAALSRAIDKYGRLTSQETATCTMWYNKDGREVACHGYSPYPGPEYGSFYYIDASLVDETTPLPVLQSRMLTATETQFLNKRLRAKRAGRPLSAHEDVRFIHEVELVYDSAVAQGLNSIGQHNTISWYAYIRPQRIRNGTSK